MFPRINAEEAHRSLGGRDLAIVDWSVFAQGERGRTLLASMNASRSCDRQSVPALKASHPAAESEPGDAGVSHVTERTGKPESLGFSIEIAAEGAPSTRAKRACGSTLTSRIRERSIMIPPSRSRILRRCDRPTALRSRDPAPERIAQP